MISTIFSKLKFWTVVFWLIMAAGAVSAVIRFGWGLGASTHLSDQFPWGLWVGFDVVCGVGLAAGGFVVAASVYIFNLEHYRPILRPAVLTAFLGYILVVVGLMFDLGKPWNVWHPIIMWNPHSVMFEVGWCVMLYSTVLALEFSPVIFEKLKLERPQKILHTITIPMVILGVVLSTLHQSSLGSLFLIIPEKVYPLWYSSSLPYLFFTSAVAVGPAMVIIESFLSSRAFHREIEIDILSQIAKVTVVALAVYLVLKIEDINGMKLWPYLFNFNFEGMMYWAELGFGVILPMGLLVNRRVRTSAKGLFVSALLVVMGFVFNRLNIAITSIERSAGIAYFPSWTEISITVMIVALGFAVFRMAVQYLPIFPEHSTEEVKTPANEVVTFIDVPVR
ncbi:MAG: Ni/Fe-hydrogenase cytochrome b subunit [Ignavibacteriae bacterium]|nr:MAG: Ni/Fe-hydrogenase cytochrome b subunit [Ignavibacteriota bacterium]